MRFGIFSALALIKIFARNMPIALIPAFPSNFVQEISARNRAKAPSLD
jgi:hypothetical protein